MLLTQALINAIKRKNSSDKKETAGMSFLFYVKTHLFALTRVS